VERNHGTHQDRMVKNAATKNDPTHAAVMVNPILWRRKMRRSQPETFAICAASRGGNNHMRLQQAKQLREDFRLETERISWATLGGAA